ncbi:efflux RND transporter periplasmic adaptor subunit [Nitratifractor sp.]|uniref:efflux RND transporter periplasmic adaptor subunit n=1 Tax=Nitratifractor sp. TaxID=2268144 RepID=UPI0025D46488|nr:efflux RND transporter periplasmic adaptor subunit [Nitratifractor sp.]
MKRKKRSIGFLLLAAGLLLSACGQEKKHSSAPKRQIPQVKVQKLEKKPRTIWVDYSSYAKAYEAVTVISRVEGQILEQTFKAGDRVRKGDLLFRIDPSDYLAAYNRALARLEKDKAALALARADLLRYTPLVQERLAPRQKMEQLQAAEKQMQATIKADEVLVADAKLKLSYCDVKAPIDGKIGRELVKPGNLVTPGTKLASIVDSRFLQAEIFPSTRDTASIQKYKSHPYPKVELFLRDDPAIRLEGAVEYISSVADERTGTVPMRVRVPNPKELILPGSFVTVRLIINDHIPAVTIAPDWVFQDQEGEFVYIVDANDTLHKAHFHSPFTNARMVVLPSTFAGKLALVQPAGSLMEGMKVRPLPAVEPAKKAGGH